MADPLDEFMASLTSQTSKQTKRPQTLVEEEEEEDRQEREKWERDKACVLEDGSRIDCLPEQTEVRMVGSDPTYKPYFGRGGTIVDFKPSEKVYTVRLFEELGKSEEFITVPASQIQQIVRGVLVEHLVGRPELNGMKGKLLQFLPDSGRYQVQLEPQKTKKSKAPKTEPLVVALKLSNVLLPAGTRVQIKGLKNTKFNGKWGMITGLALSADQEKVEAARYSVQISQTNMLNLKRENCFP